jgi:hypothetical protein
MLERLIAHRTILGLEFASTATTLAAATFATAASAAPALRTIIAWSAFRTGTSTLGAAPALAVTATALTTAGLAALAAAGSRGPGTAFTATFAGTGLMLGSGRGGLG